MLKQRFITALIMAGVFLAAIVYLPVAGLALLFGVFVCMGGWEWSRLAGWASPVARTLYVVVLAAAMAGTSIHGFLARGCQQAKARRPPGTSVPRRFWKAATESSKNITPKRE